MAESVRRPRPGLWEFACLVRPRRIAGGTGSAVAPTPMPSIRPPAPPIRNKAFRHFATEYGCWLAAAIVG